MDSLGYPSSRNGLKVNKGGRLNLSDLALQAANTDGFVLKAGTSAAPVVSATAGKFASSYFSATAASGESTGVYTRTYISTAGGEGMALRAYGTVQNVAAVNARGAHISLSFGASGTVSGLGAALEATLHIPNDASQAGTLCAIKAAINSDGSTSDPSGALLSFICIDNQGDATGGADVDDDAAVLGLSGFTQGTGNVFKTGSDIAAAATLRVRVNGTSYFLLLGATEIG